MALTATGIGSGLDIEGLVSQLVAAERGPVENRLLQREARLTSEISALGTLQGALAGVQDSVDGLTTLGTFEQRSASVTNSSALSVSVDSSAAVGSFNVEVSQLAQAQSLASGSFASLTDEVGEGTLTFRFGTTDYTPADPGPESYNGFTVNGNRDSVSVVIDAGSNTLEGVRDAINEADIGVSAVVVNDGSGFRLLLSASETGADNSIEIQVDDSGDGVDTDDAGLSRLAFNAGAANLTQTAAGRDAQLSINGLAITSAGNTVSNVVDGVTLALRNTTDSAATVSVSANEGAVRTAIDDLVESYNRFVGIANQLTDYNPETGVAGTLQGDFTARSVINQVRAALSGSAQGFDGAFSSLAEIGITTQADGTLQVDDATLSAAFADNFEDVVGVFAQVGRLDDAAIDVRLVGEARVGDLAVEITQLATQGVLSGAAISEPTALSPLTIDADNDSLTLLVDGTEAEITLTQGTFESFQELVAELQSRINGNAALSAAGARVTVSVSDSNELRITSDRFGSGSSVEISSVDTNTVAELGLSVAAGSAGQDVAGSIGGVAASGDGQVLTGAAGTDSEGVVLTVSGGEIGYRGALSVSQGIGVALNGVLEGLLGSSGILGSRTDGLQTSVERIGDERSDLDLRLEALEARYREQFNALDILLSSIESTSTFLTQQLANIPVPGADSSN
jgi:flagellar hook-associated protein 2